MEGACCVCCNFTLVLFSAFTLSSHRLKTKNIHAFSGVNWDENLGTMLWWEVMVEHLVPQVLWSTSYPYFCLINACKDLYLWVYNYVILKV